MIIAITVLLTTLVVINAVTLVYTIAHWDDHKRHTYSTIAGIEDGTAVNIDTTKEVLLLKEYLRTGYQRLNAIEARLQDQLQILQITREGPYAYDPDRPAGRRPKGMDR